MKSRAGRLVIIKAEKGNCPHCLGSGKDPDLFEDCYDHQTGHYTKQLECAFCYGAGRVSDERRKSYDPDKVYDHPEPQHDCRCVLPSFILVPPSAPFPMTLWTKYARLFSQTG